MLCHVLFHLQDMYQEICDKTQGFALEYLGLCRTAREVEVFLSQPAGVEKTSSKGIKAIFPRLLVAIHYDQKGVSHLTCVTRKQTLRPLLLSCQKKDGRAWPSSFWYDTDF